MIIKFEELYDNQNTAPEAPEWRDLDFYIVSEDILD